MSIFGIGELIWIKVADYHLTLRSRVVRRFERQLLASSERCVVVDSVNETGRTPGRDVGSP
jgi:hypothetical protein